MNQEHHPIRLRLLAGLSFQFSHPPSRGPDGRSFDSRAMLGLTGASAAQPGVLGKPARRIPLTGGFSLSSIDGSARLVFLVMHALKQLSQGILARRIGGCE